MNRQIREVERVRWRAIDTHHGRRNIRHQVGIKEMILRCWAAFWAFSGLLCMKLSQKTPSLGDLRILYSCCGTLVLAWVSDVYDSPCQNAWCPKPTPCSVFWQSPVSRQVRSIFNFSAPHLPVLWTLSLSSWILQCVYRKHRFGNSILLLSPY